MSDDAAMIDQLRAELAAARQREAALVAERAEAREQQAATSEVLRVIATSPTDAAGVLDSIVRSAAQLTDADYSTILQAEANVLRVTASLISERIGKEQPFGRTFADHARGSVVGASRPSGVPLVWRRR